MKPNDMVISTNDIEHLGNIIFTKGKKYKIIDVDIIYRYPFLFIKCSLYL